MAEDWLTTQQAADLSGYHPNHLRRLLRAHEIKGRKWGQAWQIEKQSLKDYLDKAGKIDDKRWGPK
ncbi:MAG: helix-turn-helix domain-containing protein [Anaerolineales bacterium]|nr:helix-turn-helix domain-containing protein [Anaerolineales bacterium]